MTTETSDTLEYDGDLRTLVRTNRLGPEEFGAAQVVARDVAPSFGVWAEAVWRDGVDVEALREAIYEISVRHDWEHTTDREDRTEEIAAEYARRAVPA